ncbi:MAG: outer membrane protein assembly factor [Gammaproteobacteria bacterium]|nr:outer membrane protein assembly factor [Gammaproteobacteria bacterium]
MIIAWACAAGPASAITDVDVSGLNATLAENVRAFLSIAEEDEGDEQAPSERLVRRLHSEAPDEIREALRPFGYYAPRIRARLERGEDGWSARYRIRPGPPTIVRKIDIEVDGPGGEEPAVRNALAGIDLREGARLEHSAYESAKNTLYDAVYGAGYLDARWRRSQLRIVPALASAEIILKLRTGRKYYFGEVNIEQDVLNPEFVQRFVNFEPEDPFDTNKLLDLQLALTDSGYFDNVELRVDKEEAVNQRVPVTVVTKPTRPRRYSVGAGYGTDTGPRLSLGVEFRRINRRGHSFRADLQLSTIKNAFSTQYLIPIKNVATDNIAIAGTLQQEEIGDADTEQLILGVSRNEFWRGFQRRLYFNYQREHFDFGPGTGREENLLYPGITLARKRADDPLFARKGYSVNLDVHGGDGNLLSSTSFARTLAEARAVFPLTQRSRLLVHSEAGAVLVDDFVALPPSQRFFTGGDRTVRGYNYQDIGPQSGRGANVGGRYLLAAGVEADYLFFGDFGGAVFFDAGDAFNGTPDPEKAVGVGLRYRSLVGMIRLDFAHPLDDPDNSFRFHLSIGPDL